MTIRLKTLFFIAIGILTIWFLYIERAILSPFVLAAIAAYIFNPVVNLLSLKVGLNRTLSVVIIYVFIVAAIVAFGVVLTGRFMNESFEFTSYVKTLSTTAREQIDGLPSWLKPTAQEALVALEHSKLLTPQHLLALFPAAISRIVSFIIFLFASFYFLKEGRRMVDKFLNLAPDNYRVELEILTNRMNAVLGGYLRGQIFMVFLVSLILFIFLSILGVKFALILAIFSGFAEIVPIIGPIVAASVAAIVVYITGTSNFPLHPFQAAGVIVLIYFVVRQFQDYFITPQVMGKITKLHPLVIFFAVLAGEHVGGIIGLILAVPVAGIIRILFEYSMDKVYEQQAKKS